VAVSKACDECIVAFPLFGHDFSLAASNLEEPEIPRSVFRQGVGFVYYLHPESIKRTLDFLD
jgi:hypothetical protein